MVQNLKRIVYALVLAFFCLGFVALVALALTPHIVIGEGRLGAFIHQVEKFDFKWWITGFALGLWLFPILLLITYQSAKRAGQQLHDFQGVLRSILANQTLPIIVDIDQKIPIRLDEPLAVPVELHTEVNVDSEFALEAEVPIRTELPVDTKVQTNVLGIGTVSIPIHARRPGRTVQGTRAREGGRCADCSQRDRGCSTSGNRAPAASSHPRQDRSLEQPQLCRELPQQNREGTARPSQAWPCPSVAHLVQMRTCARLALDSRLWSQIFGAAGLPPRARVHASDGEHLSRRACFPPPVPRSTLAGSSRHSP
jgi:hypothetical protein